MSDVAGRTVGADHAIPDTHVMVLPDGRDLAWTELGVPAGVPVIAFHGTPGSRLQLGFGDGPARSAGVRLVVPDRPGYGLSTFQRGRRFAGWADDVVKLADHLGLARFAVLGYSGGGPHAAACARFLPERVTAAAIVSGVDTLAEPGSERGMTGADRALVRVARIAPTGVVAYFAAVAAFARRWPDRALELLRRELPPSDDTVLARPDVRAAFRDDLRKAAGTTGSAAAQDYALFARDWGFRLEDIAVPVHLWQGDADWSVPPAHARRQAEAIPGAVLHAYPGEGHLLVAARMEEILRTVADHA